ncbi:MAG: AAA family ATPase [Deltaproteobacteria bacterium]|nr:AAA family ATPase [Deltaproteobacteria bacterium]
MAKCSPLSTDETHFSGYGRHQPVPVPVPIPNQDRAKTGIEGLDDILGGGLPRDRIYLVQGDPGVGKTTFGLQFLIDGVQAGERCLYVTLSETTAEIRAVAASHGWSLEGIDLVELSAVEQYTALDDNTLFEPAEVELHETTRTLLGHVERVQPQRVVFDSLSELRLLAQSALRYRRQILSLKQYFVGKPTTVILLDDRTSEPTDLQLQSLAHGVIMLEQVAPVYGEAQRQLRVQKLRGIKFRGGRHDFAIRTGGLAVFPRLIAAEQRDHFELTQLSSGVGPLDQLLGGGLDRGTSTLIIGPAGAGKSAVAMQYAVAAAERGDHAMVFAFDERLATLKQRARALGLPLDKCLANGTIAIQQVDPAEMSPGEFAHAVRCCVEKQGAKLVVIDSLNGYLHSVPDEKLLTIQMHEMVGYLGHLGVTSIIVMAQHGFVGSMRSPTDVSYLADTVLLLRYFEAEGRIRKAISVVKKRSGVHENAIRELQLGAGGITVGPPLVEFEGVLTGVPRYVGKSGALSER